MRHATGIPPYAPASVLSAVPSGLSAGVTVECLSSSRDLDRYAPQLESLRRHSRNASSLIPLPPWVAARQPRPGWAPRIFLLRSAGEIRAAVLLYEKTLAGLPTGYFRGYDTEGEPFLLCPSGQERTWLAQAVQRVLASRRAFLVLIDQSANEPPLLEASMPGVQLRRVPTAHHWQHTLQPTFNATLAPFGHRTRRNLRLALRRVEKNNWRFLPELNARQLLAAVSHLSRHSTHPFSLAVTAQRLKLAIEAPGGFAMALTDSDGRWLSCIIGRRLDSTADVFWQSNAAGFQADSLCTAMRALFMCSEIDRGSSRVRYIGGTCPHMQHCCTPSESLQISITRQGLRSRLTQSLLRSDLLSPAHPLRAHL